MEHRRTNNITLSRAPSAERLQRNRVDTNISNSRVDLKTSKSTYRIMSTTMQQFNRNTVNVNDTVNIFNNNPPIERAKTAKGLGSNEEEMRRTRLLMDKISGKTNM